MTLTLHLAPGFGALPALENKDADCRFKRGSRRRATYLADTTAAQP
jgi:hypothetical protein